MLPKRLSRKTIYESKWVNLYVDKGLFPDGRIIEKHHMLDFPRQAVAAVVEPNFIYSYNTSNGMSNQVVNIVKSSTLGIVSDFDKNEINEVRWIFVEEIKRMIEIMK